MLESHQALAAWPLAGPVRPAPDPGLINRTFVVGEPPEAVLQWVNPIFDPRIHHDIAALGERLASAGLETPRLLPTREGALWLDDDGACWRMLSYVPGITLHRLDGPGTAHEAGALVGRFHAALDGWGHRFAAPRRNIHETPARMAELETALAECEGHPLADTARRLGDEILTDWRLWDGPLDLPERPCHGDLKVSNLRFAEDGRGICLIDLDTVGPMSLASEMGDAWRSWCNPVAEDVPEQARFDPDLFGPSARGWLSTAPALPADERRALAGGIERISLELAARFAADAVRNVYFREDRGRWPEPGRHNLLKARGQLAFARSARHHRATCEEILR